MGVQAKSYKRGTAKYMQVRDAIYRQIMEGKYQAGSTIHSEPELVNIFGVSKMTIRQALTELENEGLLYRKQGVGTFVNDLSSAGVSRITVILPGVAQVAKQGTMFKIIHGVLEEAYSCGIALSIYAAEQYDPWKIPRHSGGVIFPTPNQELMTQAEEMARDGYRVVVINREMNCQELSFFTTDHRRSAEIGTEFLIGRGRRRIVSVGIMEQRHQLARLAGWREALERHGLEGGEVEMEPLETFVDKKQAIKTLSGADAVLVTEGRLLPLTVETLVKVGRKIPEDVEIVTFNRIEKEIPFAGFIHELVEPLEEYGRLAVRQFIDGGGHQVGRRFEAVLNIKKPPLA